MNEKNPYKQFEVLSHYVPLTSRGAALNSSLPTRTFNGRSTSFIITNNYLVEGRKKEHDTKRMERINRT